MGRMTKVTAAAAAALLVLGVAACGDDDDDTEASTDTTSAPAEGDTAAFCDSFIEFNSLALSSDAGADDATEEDIQAFGEQVVPLFQRIVDNAPADLSASAEDINEAVAPLAEGEGEAFFSDELFETYSEFTDQAVGACEVETVEVTAVDYAFEGVPDTIPAGTVALRLTNSSEEEEHEMVVFRRAPGGDLTFDELLELPEEEAESQIEFATAAFAPPGETATALAELTPGQYAMVCFIPVGGGEEGPPHFTEGMKQEFTVE